MVELDELEDVITNMLMADNNEQLNTFTIIAITLILKIKDKLKKGASNG